MALEVDELVAGLKGRGIANAEDVLEIFLRREIPQLLEAFDTESQARSIGAGVLAKVLREGGTIGPGKPAPASASTFSPQTRFMNDVTRWRGLLNELPEWPESIVISAARDLEAEGQAVTEPALRLKLGRPWLNDETDPMTADVEPVRKAEAVRAA